jgi:hypothetical protein
VLEQLSDTGRADDHGKGEEADPEPQQDSTPAQLEAVPLHRLLSQLALGFRAQGVASADRELDLLDGVEFGRWICLGFGRGEEHAFSIS